MLKLNICDVRNLVSYPADGIEHLLYSQSYTRLSESSLRKLWYQLLKLRAFERNIAFYPLLNSAHHCVVLISADFNSMHQAI